MERQEQIKATMEALRLHDANNVCMTVDECADFFKIHPKTVLNKIHSKEFKAQFIGRTWRIPKLQFIDKIVDEAG
jgi:excisionase family DNA binding protein